MKFGFKQVMLIRVKLPLLKDNKTEKELRLEMKAVYIIFIQL